MTTTQLLPPERWAIDHGSHAELVSTYAEAIGRVGYTAYSTNCLVAAAQTFRIRLGRPIGF